MRGRDWCARVYEGENGPVRFGSGLQEMRMGCRWCVRISVLGVVWSNRVVKRMWKC